MRSEYPTHLFFCVSSVFIILMTSCSSRYLRHEKIHIARFHELNEQGLIGDIGSYRAISYEFCIPRDDTYVDAVKMIETNIGMQKGFIVNMSEVQTTVKYLANTVTANNVGEAAKATNILTIVTAGEAF